VAKRKKAQPWDAVFSRIRCVWQPDKVYPPKTTAAELDAVEVELDFKFPLSYRAFAEQFGLEGDLQVFPYYICITILALRQPKKWIPEYWRSVVSRTRGARQYYGVPGQLPLLSRRSRPRPSPFAGRQHDVPRGATPTTEFANFVAFAGDDDEGLGTFLFQPLEVTDSQRREYRIFALNSARALRPVADSFWEWLEWVERSYRFRDEPHELPEGSMPPVVKPDPPGVVMQYKRDWIRDKKAPAKKNVKLWLAFNNNTARDLALSIRDAGQTDAFPILADALEEAGCTNADLLDSCRTGDPDIDGVWVLQVLLGKA